MNERIKELAKQAEEFSHWTNHGYTANYRINPEKFAELIIKECIDQCADNGSNDEWDKGVRWAANQIKEHFGVEE
jgi:hypothetical protein